MAGGVELVRLEGDTALRLTDSLNGEDYYTYIYSDSSYLYELTVRAGTTPRPELGERILQVQDFTIADAGNGFLEFTAADSGGSVARFLLRQRSGAY